jgi:magnesium-protoporphyrin O-methyltransferase
VLAIDLSPTLVNLARERMPAIDGAGRIDFRSGDMLDHALGQFDFVVGMDSLIHYRAADAVRVLAGLAPRTSSAMLFTFAPSSPALAAMHAVGKLFPRGDRAPSIVPVAEHTLHRLIAEHLDLQGWSRGRTQRIASGFYTSQALELVRS